MRSQLTTGMPSAWNLFDAQGQLDGLEASLSGYDKPEPHVNLHWGPVSLFLSTDAATTLARSLNEAVAALEASAHNNAAQPQEVSHG